MNVKQDHVFDFAIVGGGLAGLVCALKLARSTSGSSNKIALVTHKNPLKDLRTTAMLMPTIDMMEELDIWEPLKELSAPLTTMRLIDGSSRLIRAPIADFRASETGLEAFGYNVPNADMIDLLLDEVAKNPLITKFESPLTEGEYRQENVQLTLRDGSQLSTKLAIAAEGRNSKLRELAAITKRDWSYPQTAIVLTFSHTLPHNGVSAEFHTETGPFTQVPLPPRKDNPNRSSLVWVVKPEEVEHLLDRNLAELSVMIEEKMQSCFGKCRIEEKPGSIPLSGMIASRFAQNRIALIGESGHVFPPIGAQGFNLGARDISDLIQCIGKSEDPGSPTVLNTYHEKRRSDVNLRTLGIDVMNRSLLTDFLPVQAFRTAGISALNSITPLRKLAMQQGLGGRLEMPSVSSVLNKLSRREQVRR